MTTRWTGACSALLVTLAATIAAQVQNPPMPHASAQSVSPSFEGWYTNPDGSHSLVFGYLNRNFEQRLDIPIGAANRFEPGPEDRGQPTHFLPRRQTGLFSVVVPADFGNERLYWSVTSGGQTFRIPGHLRKEWEIDALREKTSGNEPPTIRFDATAAPALGPGGIRSAARVTFPAALPLQVLVADDGARRIRGPSSQGGLIVGVTWSKYRGPGTVTFKEIEPAVRDGVAATEATFSEPGTYTLRVLAWDNSGKQSDVMAGGFFCCWTNGYVDVVVEPGASSGR